MRTLGSYKVYSIIIFIIWPFAALLSVFRNYKSSSAKNIVWLFTIYFGLTFVIADAGFDSSSYREKFEKMAIQYDLGFNEFIGLLYNENTKYVDVIQPLLSFLVSRVTDNYHVLFAVFGLIFGFFYSRNIWYLFDHSKSRVNLGGWLLIIVFSLIVGIWQINGFRFWTATHIFFYGAFGIIYESRRKMIGYCILAIFVHFAFMVPLVVLLVYLVLGNRLTLYFYFFVATLFVTNIGLNLKQTINYGLPAVFQNRVDSYSNEQYIDKLKEKRETKPPNWYKRYYQVGLRWFLISMAVIAFRYRKSYLRNNLPLISLFSFALLFFGFANFIAQFPSGGRFTSIAFLFMMAFIYLLLDARPQFKAGITIRNLAIPILLFFIVVSLRFAFDALGVNTILGNAVTVLFVEEDVPLITLIKTVL